ncbi:uncharacterized protein EDB91DRAFT_814819 [Suillus paluster]|uniref:uncharacterized protein n=1 Tax=Suillus paluster TaxID=48578 RepID=UPI001B884D90|nr:uncharacterized protein EDB91DRAFT_814819 [Suillus paluster]KAG1729349.1 hypothetical protein EDB91DRAFT_814819 [Suillus paluster]
MGNEYTTKTSGAGTLTHWNINYAHAHKRQDDGLTSSSSSYLSSSTSLDSTLTDSPTAVLDPGSTSANAAAIISISALPPLTTTLPHALAKLPYHQHLNVIFLAPLFAVLGIILGVGAASLWWKSRSPGSGVCGLGGRRNGRGSRISLQPGPAYAPAPNEGDGSVNDVEGTVPSSDRNRSMEEVTLFAAGTPSKTTVHGTRYLFPAHMREPTTGSSAVIKPLCTPFLMGASKFHSGGNGDPDHGDPFTSTHRPSSSGTYDAERADGDEPRRSIFHRILNRPTLADSMQYAAVRVHDPSPSTYARLNPAPILTPSIHPANTLNSTTSHGGRSSAVDVPLRSLDGGEGEVQRPVRAWLDTPGGAGETPGGESYGDDKARKYKSTGDKRTAYAPVEADTPRTPVSKVGQFWTPPWKKNKTLPLHSSPSPAQPSPSTTRISQPPSSPSRMPRSAVSPAGHAQQDLHCNRRDDVEKGTESEPTSLEHRTSIPHIDSSVLPRSPPFLMSPPLEAALLFTSTSCAALGFASLGPKLGSRSPPTSKANIYTAAYDSPLRSKTKSKSSKANLGSSKVTNVNQSTYETSPDISLFPLPSSTKKLKKPKNQSRSSKGRGKGTKSSPILPFPSYPDHLVHAGHKASVSMSFASSTSQPALSPTPTMLAILAATQSLERVNEILVRGYSERALGGGDVDRKKRTLRGNVVVAGVAEESA